jgi:hypothetical protein
MSETAEKIVTKMSEEDRKILEDQIKEDQLILANPDGLATEMQHKGKVQESIQAKQKALAKDEDLIAKGEEKDRVYRRIKELETKLKQHMPSRNEMWQKLGTDGSTDAVKKNRYFHKTFAKEIQELVNLKRRLEPDDPNAGSLERIRPT